MIKKRITLCVMCLLELCASVWAQGSGGTPPDEGEATYTISFNKNKGSGSTDVNGEMMSQSVTQSEVNGGVTLTPVGYSRDGYTFSGWATEAGGVKVYDDQTPVSTIDFSEQTSIDLHAVWTANTYTVKFDRNGSSLGSDMDAQQFTYDVEQKLRKNTYEKLLHTFHGWNTAANASGEGYADEKLVLNLTAEPNGTVILYAQWDLQPFTIGFDANGGLGTIDSLDVEDDKETLPECTFTRRGYVFDSWNTQSDGSGTRLEAGGNAADAATGSSIVTLYAQWKPITYKVRYDANVPEEFKDEVGSMKFQTLTWDVEAKLSENKFSYRGHNFVYWSGYQVPPKDDDGKNNDDKGFDTKEEVMNLHDKLGVNPVQDGEVTLYAQWESIVYNVAYHANAADAQGEMPSQNIPYGEKKSLNSNVFQRPGYTFAKWNTDSLGGGTAYDDGAEVLNLMEEMDGIYDLYAQWTPITYTLSFDANRGDTGTGEGEMESMQFTYAVSQPLNKNTFTRTGYAFAGWNTRADGTGRAYADGQQADSLVTVAGENCTLYAQWTPNQYQVAFDPNNGRAYLPEGVEMNPQTFVYDTELALTANLYQHKDSSFIGWARTAEATEVEFMNRAKVKNLTAEPGATVTLYALWGSKDYFVRFYPNGGEGEMPRQQLTVSVAEELNRNTFERTGYTFRGWATSADGSRVYDDGEEVLNLASEAGVEVPLYAVWEENSYRIRFQAGNGSGTMDQIQTTYTKPVTLPGNEGFVLRGYTFTGWNTLSGGNGTSYEAGQEVQLTANLILYAQWKPNEYIVRYDANGGRGEMSDLTLAYDSRGYLAQNAFIRAGHSFIGWNTRTGGDGIAYEAGAELFNLTDKPDTTLVFYAQWREHVYRIRFNKGIETAGGSMTDLSLGYTDKSNLTTCGFILPGYTFTGWNTQPDGSGTSYADKQSVGQLTETDGEVIDLYAQWTANSYTILFYGNGGEGEMESMNCTYDGESQTLAGNGFTRTGYTYRGWNTQPDGTGVSYADGVEVYNWTASPNAYIRLYAQWTANEYTVRYDANGGEGTLADLPMTYDETAVLAANAFTRTGHTYTGWNTRADGTGTPYADRAEVLNWTAVDNEIITLYAQWRAHTYTVLYVANGGDGDMDNQAFVYGRAQALTANAFTRTGYTFSGWNTKMNGTGTAYADGQEVSDLSAKDGDFVGLYAQWTPLQYNVVFKNDDGTALQSGKCDYGTTPVYGGETPVKPSTAEYDYVFTGWTPELAPVTGDAEYTAVYRAERRSYTVSFVSEGETLQSDLLEYGSTPYYRGDDPVKPSTAEYDYVFTGWTPELAPVTGDAVYTAVFEETGRTYLHGTQAGGMTVRTEALHIYVSGIADSEEVAVFDVNGRQVYRGIGRDIEVPATGLYMLYRAGETLKVIIK